MFMSASPHRVNGEAEGDSVEEVYTWGRAVPPTCSSAITSSSEQYQKHFLIYQRWRDACVFSLCSEMLFKKTSKTQHAWTLWASPVALG